MRQGDPETSNKPLVLCLMGATATGKTALAIALRQRLPVEIVSVDASQVYRGMDIGTAKPTPAELVRAPHRLIDIRDPAEPYSAAQFCDDARREIEAIHQAGRIPLLVGGTMFYFRALEYGLSDLPSADPDIRERLLEEAAQLGWPALHARLTAIDPTAGARIHPNDTQRVQRALEIIEITGQGPSAFSGSATRNGDNYRFIKLSLMIRNREELHEKIIERFSDMLAHGLVEEVERLYRRGDLSPELPSVRTVGYRQLWDYLSNNINYNSAIETAIAATRQLAKRQITWLRSYPGVQNFDVQSPALLESILEYITVSAGVSPTQ